MARTGWMVGVTLWRSLEEAEGGERQGERLVQEQSPNWESVITGKVGGEIRGASIILNTNHVTRLR